MLRSKLLLTVALSPGMLWLNASFAEVEVPPPEEFLSAMSTAPANQSWALSPEGERVVTIDNEGPVLWMRVISLADRSVTRIPVGESQPGAELPPALADLEEMLRPFRAGGSLIKARLAAGIRNRITWAEWKGDDRILFRSSIDGALWAIDADGGNPLELVLRTADDDETGSGELANRRLLDSLPQTPHRVLIQQIRSGQTATLAGPRHGTFLVDVQSGKLANLVDDAFPPIQPFVDRFGFLRGGMRHDAGERTAELVFWDPDTQTATTASERYGAEIARAEGLLTPIKLNRGHDDVCFGWIYDPNILYTVRPTASGGSGLFAFDLTQGQAGAPAFESDTFDLVGGTLITDSFNSRVVGFRFQELRPTTLWFDDHLQEVQAALNEALPGRVNEIVQWDRTLTRFLFKTLSDQDWGGVGIYTRSESGGKVEVLSQIQNRPGRGTRTVAVNIPAPEGPILAYLTISPDHQKDASPPALLILLDDSMTHREGWIAAPSAQYLAAAGLNLLRVAPRETAGLVAPNGRPQGTEYYRRVTGDIEQAARWARESGLVGTAGLHVVGDDYGSYVALMLPAEYPGLFNSVVAQNPVSHPLEWLNGLGWSQGRSNDTAWMLRELYARKWGNWRRNKAEMRNRSPFHRANEITAPVLIIHGQDNRVVQPEDSERMIARLKRSGQDAELLLMDDSTHGSWPPRIRPLVLEHIVEFVSRPR